MPFRRFVFCDIVLSPANADCPHLYTFLCVFRITKHEIVMKVNVDDVHSAKRDIAMFHNDCMEHTRWENVFCIEKIDKRGGLISALFECMTYLFQCIFFNTRNIGTRNVQFLRNGALGEGRISLQSIT